MEFIKRLFRRGGETVRQGDPALTPQTNAQQDAANRYWKAEVAADLQRRGKPDKSN